jgi:uncharacterized protein DUF6268
MKNLIRTGVVCLCFAASHLFAGGWNGNASAEDHASSGATPFPFEAEVEYTYVGDSTVQRDDRVVRDFDEAYSYVRFVYTPRIKIGILRLGAAAERFGFGMSDQAELADTLQSYTAIVGLDTQLSDSILVRFEAEPGVYGTEDHLDGDTFNVPVVLGGTYIVNSDLQFVLGVSVNYERQFPVFPGGGVRWHFASQWVLNAVLPTPRLEFAATENLTFYAGANLKGSTFRTQQHFGNSVGNPDLNNAVLDYSEVRTGAGMQIKLSPQCQLSIEGGFVPYREFDYHRTDVRYHHEDGAAYASFSFNAAF